MGNQGIEQLVDIYGEQGDRVYSEYMGQGDRVYSEYMGNRGIEYFGSYKL